LHCSVDLIDAEPHNSTTEPVRGEPTIRAMLSDGAFGDAEVLGSLQNGDVVMA
jgi:hypothetical protein